MRNLMRSTRSRRSNGAGPRQKQLDVLRPAGVGDKGTDPCQLLLQFLYQGEGLRRFRLAAEGLGWRRQGRGAWRAEVADDSLHAMRYARRAFGVSHAKSSLDLG